MEAVDVYMGLQMSSCLHLCVSLFVWYLCMCACACVRLIKGSKFGIGGGGYFSLQFVFSVYMCVCLVLGVGVCEYYGELLLPQPLCMCVNSFV